MMRRYFSHIKRIEKQLQADIGQPMSIVVHQAKLIYQYLHDEMTADEFDEQSLAPDNKLTSAEYQANIFNKYLKEID